MEDQHERVLDSEQLEKMLTTEDATKIPQFQQINKSVCMIITPDGDMGTGFLADVPGHGVTFLSAGHNFGVKNVLHNNLDISKFTLHFGNQDGDRRGRNALKTCHLSDLGSVKGSIGLRGKKLFFPGNIDAMSLLHEDYCLLILTDPDIKNKLKNMGLAYLEVGHGDFLKYIPNGLVEIWGHPSNQDIRKKEGNKAPLCHSIGTEMVPVDNRLTRLEYNANTLPGMSGSPVIGVGSDAAHGQSYVVKGIHVAGALRGRKSNIAQGLWNLDDWIPQDQVPLSSTLASQRSPRVPKASGVTDPRPEAVLPPPSGPTVQISLLTIVWGIGHWLLRTLLTICFAIIAIAILWPIAAAYYQDLRPSPATQPSPSGPTVSSYKLSSTGWVLSLCWVHCWGDCLGQYDLTGQSWSGLPVYRGGRDGNLYMYRAGDFWWGGVTVGGEYGVLRAAGRGDRPPAAGWQYEYRLLGATWYDDPDMKCEEA